MTVSRCRFHQFFSHSLLFFVLVAHFVPCCVAFWKLERVFHIWKIELKLFHVKQGRAPLYSGKAALWCPPRRSGVSAESKAVLDGQHKRQSLSERGTCGVEGVAGRFPPCVILSGWGSPNDACIVWGFAAEAGICRSRTPQGRQCGAVPIAL